MPPAVSALPFSASAVPAPFYPARFLSAASYFRHSLLRLVLRRSALHCSCSSDFRRSRTFPASCRSCISYILSFFCHCFFLPNFSCLFSEPVTHIRLSYHFSCFFATIPKHFRHNIPSVPISKHLHTAFTRPSLRVSEALPQPPYPYHNTDNFRDDRRRSHVPLSPQVLYRRQTIYRSFHH